MLEISWRRELAEVAPAVLGKDWRDRILLRRRDRQPAAVRMPDLGAGAPFYGRQPSAEDTAKIKAPLMLHYAGNDPGVDQGIPAFEAALKANNKKYEVFVYDGAQHGFHNDTTPRYDEKAAKLAWQRTLEFFNNSLADAAAIGIG